jgi:hypothetical protein
MRKHSLHNVQKFNVNSLKDPIMVKELQKATDERLATLQIEEYLGEEMNSKWVGPRTVVTGVTENILGQQPKSKSRDWFDETFKMAVEERNTAYRLCTDRSMRLKQL